MVAARDIFNSGQRDELSVNGVRARVEQELELGFGFFTSANWKGRSKDIIKDAVVSFTRVAHLPPPLAHLEAHTPATAPHSRHSR